MATGKHSDDFDELPLPVLADDFVMMGRGAGGYRVGKRTLVNPAPLVAINRPQAADFGTWLNQLTATITDEDYGFNIYAPPKGNVDNLHIRVRNLPGSAGERRSITVGIMNSMYLKSNLTTGICMRETATQKLELWGVGALMQTEKWDTPTGGRGTRRSVSDFRSRVFLRWVLGGNYYQPFISEDGLHFSPFSDPILLLDYLTVGPNTWGVYINTNNVSTPNGDVNLFCFHYAEIGTNPDNIITNQSSYMNKYGSGNRAALITVTTNATITGSISELVDGDYLTNTSKPFFTADASGNRHITFQFTAAALVTEAKFYMNTPVNEGTWKWQNSPDGVTYTDRSATFTLTGSSAGTVIGDLSANTSSQPYWRLQQTAGSLVNTPFLRQVDFKTLN